MTFETMVLELLKASKVSLEIFVLTLIFAMPLGLLVYFGRESKIKPISWLVQIYISIMRGTPLTLQLMVIYFGPKLLLGINVPGNWRLGATIIAFAINYAAYFAEIYRGGISSIPRGQYEAADVLGYTKGQTFVKIILPQMIKRIVPPTTNEVITLVKDTSLAYIIGNMDLFTKARQIAVSPKLAFDGMLAFVVAAVFYYVFNFIVSTIMNIVEKKLNYYE